MLIKICLLDKKCDTRSRSVVFYRYIKLIYYLLNLFKINKRNFFIGRLKFDFRKICKKKKYSQNVLQMKIKKMFNF